ncbi:MAG: hypothetical protein PHW04_12740 [Candidatus Wallbacteria bacterium]|nr:hypothetical protein [Candidatus Wallbacteria bacterium]
MINPANIECRLHIHDRYHIEQKMAYLPDGQDRESEYRIENYIFIPKNLGINERAYPKSEIYHWIKNYVRFRNPKIPVSNLISSSQGSPLCKLKTIVESLGRCAGDRKVVNAYEHELKMFGSITRSTLRDLTTFIRDNGITRRDRERLIGDFISSSKEVIAGLEKIWTLVCIPQIPRDLQSEFLWLEEAVNMFVNESCFDILEILNKKLNIHDEPDLNAELLNLIAENNSAREKLLHHKDGENGTNESYVFRKRILKKFVSSVLFLNVSVNEESKKLEHLLFALSAGISMIFATAVAYYFNLRYGNFSFPMLVAGIIAYMFKDRIKVLGQDYFRNILSRHYYDHKIMISVPGAEKAVGVCREYIRYQLRHDLPKKIAQFTEQNDFYQLERELSGENIILYKKKIRLDTGEISKLYDGVSGIIDITRLNFKEFLSNMDEPDVPVFAVNNGAYTCEKGEKLYHVHLVTHLHSGITDRLQCFRIVLNRRGLKRIDQIDL